ncbi:MBL fold metallo-hydrolase [Agromyces sp. G08B096]|uniref:MBL fold metallo-hydrolase n=1 Tax=Agromyces sp. G08B096 TaxID=3156399 RepID=A0AAU7W4K2_9MICO
MNDWTEVASGVHQRRYDPLDISIVVVEGDDGLLLVDSRADPVEAAELRDDVGRRFGVPVRRLVNTHAHYDHTFGNQVFAMAGRGGSRVELLGHARIAAHFAEYEGPRLAAWRRDPSREPGRRWQDVELVPPTVPVAEERRIDVGGREVRLLPQPPAHTDTDLVLHVPDVEVWVLGDLVEESGPPMYGSGSFPLAWPGVVAALAGRMEPGALVVPGHGRVVDPGFVDRQAADLGLVADRLAAAHADGVPASGALARFDDWPFPVDGLGSAVDRAYLALDGDAAGHPSAST